MVKYVSVNNVEAGDLCYYEFHGEYLIVEILKITRFTEDLNTTSLVDIVLFGNDSVLTVPKIQLFRKRYC